MTAQRPPFASVTMTEHLVRGAIGIAAVALAIRLGARYDTVAMAASLAFGIVALIALRGCPVCWTTGLIGMIAERRGRARAAPRRIRP